MAMGKSDHSLNRSGSYGSFEPLPPEVKSIVQITTLKLFQLTNINFW